MDTITEIGLGGALVIALGIIKDVVAKLFIKRNGSSHDHGDTAGSQSKDYWKVELKGMEERICTHQEKLTIAMESRLMRRLDDLYAAMQTLIRWKGGD